MKAIVLFSAGLDSLLVSRILQEMGIEVIGLNICTPFHDSSVKAAYWAEKLQIRLVVRHFTDDYIDILSNPKWGYGKGLNPCLDCRIKMCQAARELMEAENADFVATGEVAGQRPNSQKIHQLNLITRESGLKGKLLRPLSAKVLPPTDMELDGTLDRDRLYSFTGRYRVRLIGLAKRTYGISTIPQPSSGCLLCEKSYVPKLRDLIRYKRNITLWDTQVLAAGRQIRIDEQTKCVVGRRESDCHQLEELYRSPNRSRSVLLYPNNYLGAAVLLICNLAPDFDSTETEIREELKPVLRKAGALMLRFSKPEKYNLPEEGPNVHLYYGQNHLIYPVFPDDSVLEYPIIQE